MKEISYIIYEDWEVYMDYLNDEYTNYLNDYYDTESAVVLSIDRKRAKSGSGPEIGLTWSEDVFNYIFDNMDYKRIEKFLEDSYSASYQNYLSLMMGRQINL